MTKTEEKWSARVSAWRASGLSAREFSMGHDFTAGGLRHWAHLLGKRGLPPTAVPSTGATLVRLARVEPRPASSPAALRIEVGGARLSVPPGFDEVTVRAVLAVLLDGSGRAR